MKIKIGNKTFEVSKEELDGNTQEITINYEGTIRTPDEEAIFIENHKKAARTEGAEKAIRTKADELGLEIKDGSKRDFDAVFKAYQEKILSDASVEPTEQLKKIQSTLQEKETALQSALSRVNDKDAEFKSYKNQTKLDQKLDGLIPANTILPKEDIKLILRNKLKFDFDEEGNVLALDAMGNVIKDTTTANPKDAKSVIEAFFQDNQSYLKPIEGGSGGGDSSPGAGKKSIDDFIKEQNDKGIKPNSKEFQDNLAPLVKQGLIDVD